jgi:hypothetical protein
MVWAVALVLATDERAFEVERSYPHAHVQEPHYYRVYTLIDTRSGRSGTGAVIRYAIAQFPS